MAAIARTLRSLSLARPHPSPQSALCTQCRRSLFTGAVLQSGHNKWSKIKHDKLAKDVKKSKERAAHAGLITFYAKLCGPDPTQNPQLAAAINIAKKAALPKDKIESAIARGQGRSLTGAILESMTFEAIFAPSMALIVEVETDNKIRALQDVREILKDWGAVQSSTKFLFSRMGRVVFAKGEGGLDADSIMDDAIEAGAEDIRTDANGNIIIWTQPSLTSQVCEQLGGKLGLQVKSSDIIWSPNKETEAPIDPSANIFYFTRLLESLRDHPEVQAIYANVSKGGASDEDWAKIEDSLDACIDAQTDSL